MKRLACTALLMLSGCGGLMDAEHENLRILPENQRHYVKLEQDYAFSSRTPIGMTVQCKIERGIYVATMSNNKGIFYGKPTSHISLAQSFSSEFEPRPSFHRDLQTDQLSLVQSDVTKNPGFFLRTQPGYPFITGFGFQGAQQFIAQLKPSSQSEYVAMYGKAADY